jgi:opacity protein-like surface antigen
MKSLATSLATLSSTLVLGATTCLGYNGWGIYAAYWSPSDGDAGYGAGAKITAEMVPGVQMEFRSTYFDDLAEEPAGYDVSLEVIPLELGLALAMPAPDPKVQFLVGGGIGYYLMDGGVRGPGVDVSADNEVGFYLSGGVEYQVRPNAALFAEAKYTFVTADDMAVTSAGDLDDADLNGIGVNLGILITW